MSDGFTNKDRNMLVETHTIVHTYDKRLDKLEAEDSILHKRITEGRKETDKRINGIKFFSGGAALVGSGIGSFFAFLKTLKGG